MPNIYIYCIQCICIEPTQSYVTLLIYYLKYNKIKINLKSGITSLESQVILTHKHFKIIRPTAYFNQ